MPRRRRTTVRARRCRRLPRPAARAPWSASGGPPVRRRPGRARGRGHGGARRCRRRGPLPPLHGSARRLVAAARGARHVARCRAAPARGRARPSRPPATGSSTTGSSCPRSNRPGARGRPMLRPVARTSATSSASKSRGSCRSKTMTPWWASASAALAPVTTRAPRTRPNVLAGVSVSGRQNGPPSVAVISAARSALVAARSNGRRARSGAKIVASWVARFVTFTTVCSRTASTEPNVRSSQSAISGGGSVRPRTTRTSRSRSARSRAPPSRRSMIEGSSRRPVSRAPDRVRGAPATRRAAGS